MIQEGYFKVKKAEIVYETSQQIENIKLVAHVAPFPYYSHTIPIRIPWSMGMVWEAYGKGVPLRVPGEIPKPMMSWWCWWSNKPILLLMVQKSSCCALAGQGGLSKTFVQNLVGWLVQLKVNVVDSTLSFKNR